MRRGVAILSAASVALSALPASASGVSEEEQAAMSLYRKGRARYDAGDWVAAEDLFSKSIAVYANPYARLYRAASLSRLSRCPEARAELDRFAPERVDPKSRGKAREMTRQVLDACPVGVPATAEPTRAAPASAPSGAVPAPPSAPPEPATAPAPATPVAAPAADGSGRDALPESADPPLPARQRGAKAVAPGRPLVVSPDGKGDFVRLEDALARARPGATIHLSEGTHRLARPLDVTTPVRLEGAGRDATTVVGDAEDHVLRFSGKGPFEVHDLSIQHQGAAWARVVVVDGGEIDLRGLRVSGGVRDEASRRGGEGLLLQGDATGRVSSCEFTGNALHGIRLAGQARPLLEGNTCRSNGRGGIVWFEDSGGTARANNCSSNGQYGMAVVDRARPRLAGNACSDNRRGGLYLERDDLDGISENRCEPYRPR